MFTATRLLIVDPGMTFVYGHNHAYNLALEEACRRAGLPAFFFFSHTVDQKALSAYSLPIRPLTWSFYEQCRKTEQAGLELVRASATAFASALHQTIDPLLEPDEKDAARPSAVGAGGSLLFSHSLSPLGLLGLLLWRAELPPGQSPALAVNLMLDMDSSPSCAERLLACKALLDADQRGFACFAGTRAAAALAARLLERPCSMLPSPLPAHLSGLRQQQAPKKPLYHLLGVGREGKNLHLLPVVIQRYLRQGGAGRFIVQMPGIAPGLLQALLALHDLAGVLPQCLEAAFDHLENDAYYKSLAESSALLLPYDPAAYHRFRPSGPAIEAAALGVPVISFAGGFIEDELEPLNNGSLFAARTDSACLTEALLTFDREAAMRKARAMAVAPAYARRHNAGHLLDLLCAARD